MSSRAPLWPPAGANGTSECRKKSAIFGRNRAVAHVSWPHSIYQEHLRMRASSMQNSPPTDPGLGKREAIQVGISAHLHDRYAALIEEHGNLADAFGIAEQEIHDCYEEALQAYRRGDYLLASQDFSLLTFVNPKEGQLHLATGNALQQLGEYAEALQYFSAAVKLMPADPGAWFRVAECQAALSQRGEACDTLRQCLNLCTAGNVRPDLYPHAKALLDQLL
ncbi:tetratricopeptide repeat protein [Trinickia sp. EG282A]|uniref:tetratricopeptide repeat protein n=1 Tax=Trinickia sp. EG282A TaxID=3237013 RepID=UPI0034D2C7C4